MLESWHWTPRRFDMLETESKKRQGAAQAAPFLFGEAVLVPAMSATVQGSGVGAASEAGSDNLERELSEAIRLAAPDVVRNLIVKANEGSYLHAKFLFELAGLDLKQDATPPDEGDESLAGYLLKELRESAGQSTESRREG